jgi:hypothetical protein
MIKLSLIKKLKGMPVDIAEVLIKYKGHLQAPYIDNVLSLHPQKNTILISQKDGKILFAKAADVLDLEV